MRADSGRRSQRPPGGPGRRGFFSSETQKASRTSPHDAPFAGKAVVAESANEHLGSRKFPVILYHPGTAGTYEDNSALFEYLASHRYIVVSQSVPVADSRQQYLRQPTAIAVQSRRPGATDATANGAVPPTIRSRKGHRHARAFPDVAESKMVFGVVALLDDDDFTTALSALRLAEKTYPKNAGIQALLGQTLAATGDKTGAERAYRKALVLCRTTTPSVYFARIGRLRLSAA